MSEGQVEVQGLKQVENMKDNKNPETKGSEILSGQKKTTQSRIDYLDIAKGFAMICIVMGHLGIDRLNSFVYTFHVPIFFLISGYFLTDKLSVPAFVKKKARQLLIPYAVTSFFIIAGVTLRDVIETKGFENVVYNVKTWTIAALYGSGTIEYQEPFYIKQIGAIWFLLALFFALIIVRFSMNWRYGFIGVAVLAYVGYKTTTMVWLPWSVQAGMTAAVFVYIGFMAGKYRLPEKKTHPAVLSVLAGIWLICILFCGRMYVVRNHYENGLLDVLGALAGSYIVVLLCEKAERYTNYIAKYLKFLGRNSLLFLCCHAVEQQVIPWGFVWTVFGEKLQFQYVTIVAVWIFLRVLLCTAGVLLCLRIKEALQILKQKHQSRRKKDMAENGIGKCIRAETGGRIKYWDIAKGITILLMILGHADGIPQYLRTIIFSFHMPLFIIVNGYFIKSYDVKKTFRNSVKSLLLPYTAVCLVSAMIYTVTGWETGSAGELFVHKIKAMLGGMSKVSTRFQSFESVWVVWFVCCLFLARNLYVVLMKMLEKYSDSIKTGAVLILALIGYLLGKYFAFLPWSLDVALVSLVFIAFGQWAGKTQFFEKNSFYTFVLPLGIWIYFLRMGVHIELATRSYPLGGLTIIEAIAGSIVVITVSKMLAKATYISDFLAWAGRNSMLILGVHCIELMYFNWDAMVYSYLPFTMNWFRIFIVKSVVILMCVAVIKLLQAATIKGYKKFCRRI